jgi:hypothetical protein
MLPLTELELDGNDDLYGAGVSGSRGSWCGGSLTTWHNPNLMQMVETLRAVMIAKRNALEGIPVWSVPIHTLYLFGLLTYAESANA